jgi:hypothetical protein
VRSRTAARRRLRSPEQAEAYDGCIVPDPDHIITGGQNNTTARMISFYAGDTVPRRALTAMLRQIIANNRAGGWRKLR